MKNSILFSVMLMHSLMKVSFGDPNSPEYTGLVGLTGLVADSRIPGPRAKAQYAKVFKVDVNDACLIFRVPVGMNVQAFRPLSDHRYVEEPLILIENNGVDWSFYTEDADLDSVYVVVSSPDPHTVFYTTFFRCTWADPGG